MPAQSYGTYKSSIIRTFFSTRSQSDQVIMESIQFTEVAAQQYVEEGIEICRKYRVLPGKDLKDDQGTVVTSAFPSKVNYAHCLHC